MIQFRIIHFEEIVKILVQLRYEKMIENKKLVKGEIIKYSDFDTITSEEIMEILTKYPRLDLLDIFHIDELY